MHIQTVHGKLDPAQIEGPVLSHEHLALDLRTSTDSGGVLDAGHAAAIAVELEEARGTYRLGLVVDQTCRGMGRDVGRLRQISTAAAVPVVAATGWYYERFHPAGEPGEDLDAATDLLLRELTTGIDGTDACAGVIGEIGTHGPQPTPAERTALLAAGLAGVATGRSIATHAHLGTGALAQLKVLAEAGADLSRVCIGHQDLIDDAAQHEDIAGAGAYLAFDTVGKESYELDGVRLRRLLALLESGLQRHILLSNDISRYAYLRGEGGQGYAHVLGPFARALRRHGVDDCTIAALYRDNALRWLTGGDDVGSGNTGHIGEER